MEGATPNDAQDPGLEAWKVYLSCQEQLEQLWKVTDLAIQWYRDQNTAITSAFKETLEQNKSMREDLAVQKNENDFLVSDMIRICDEQQRLWEDRETERLQKEIEQLMLEECRDQIKKLEEEAVEKDNRIQSMAEGEETLTSLRQELEKRNAQLARVSKERDDAAGACAFLRSQVRRLRRAQDTCKPRSA